MAVMTIEPPRRAPPVSGFALFALGFRPFFLVAGLSALLYIPAWLLAFHGESIDSIYYDALSWHQHEMIFGFGMAVLAGFLMTAVRNWTNLPTPAGWPLAGLLLLWLAGRALPFAAVPAPWVVGVDLLFALLVALAIARPLWSARQWLNMIFPALLLLIALGNGLFHLAQLGVITASTRLGSDIGLFAMVWVMMIMGGRVIPFFIEKGLGGEVRVRKLGWLDQVAMVAWVATMIAVVSELAPLLQASVAFAAAVLHAVRLIAWHDARLWSVPLLWVLWLGYAWVVLGLALQGAAALGVLPTALATHALASGALGTLALGMMARVTLGHTGRPMQLTSRLMPWAFGLVVLTGILRVLVPALWPDFAVAAIVLAGACWTMAFAIFCWVTIPMLWRPRVDGRPG